MIQTPDLVDIAARLSNESDAYISGFLEVRKDAPSPTYQRLITILKKVIDRSYTDGVDRFLSVKVDDAGNISGYFADGARTIKFALKGNNLSTKLARVRTDSLAIRFDKKKRNCLKGHPCKGTCISKNKTCLAKLGEIASPGEVAQLRQAAVNLKLEQNAANKSLEPAPDTPLYPITPAPPTPPKQDYQTNPDTGKPYTIRELKKVASQKGVVGYSNMTTEELRKSIKFVDETPPEQQQRLAKTIASDRSTGSRAIDASGVTGRQKRSLKDNNRTWKNLQTLAKFAGSQPVGWGAAAIGAFILGASIRQYERAKGEYRSRFKEAAEEAQERAANLGSSKNGLIQRTQKNNITFLISAGKGSGGSEAIQKNLEKYKDSEDEGDRWLANNHHFIPFNLKESGAKPGGNDIENSVNGLTDYLTNFKRGKDQDAVDLAAQIYAYGIQRKQPESVATGLRKIQGRYETLIKQEGKLQARVENLQQLVERQTNPIQKRVLESRLAIAQSAVTKSQNQKRNNRTAYAKLEKEGDKKLKPALANKGKNINILAHSRAGQTSKTAMEYLARMQLPGEPTGKEVLEQVNLVMLGTPHFGFTENVSKRQRTLISAQDPISTLPVFGEGARQQWISTVKGHGWESYLEEPRSREAIREVFGYYEDSLLERRRKEEKAKTKGDSAYFDSYLRTLARIDAKKAVCKTGKPCKTKSGKVVCIPKSHKCASEAVGLAQSKTPFYQNRNFQVGLAAAGVSTLMVGGALAGAVALVKHDLVKSKSDFTSIRQPPGGIPDEQTLAKYDTFKPGDLIRKNFKSDNLGERSHYAVYVGKDPKTGEHTLIDTGEDWKTRDNVPYVRSRGLTWDAGPNDTEYEKVPPEEMNLVEGTKQLTGEEIVERSQKMLYQSFKYEGFESNCEAFARGMVEGKAYSSQGQKVSPLTNFTSRIVTDKVLTLRTLAEGDKAKAFNAEGEVVKTRIGPYQFTGLSDYGKDKYRMTASQMVDYLEREAVMAERRKWEDKANPYSGAIEKGYLTHLQESQKEATKAAVIKEQDKDLVARNTIKPFNRFAITVRVDKVKKDSEVEDFLAFLGMRSPEEFTKIVEQISEPFGEMKKAMQIKLYKDYLVMLFALLNQDLGVKDDSYWEGFNSVRLDKVNCKTGKPCKTKSGKEICIPKSHKCSSQSSLAALPSAQLSLPAPIVPGLATIGVFSAYMAARDVMNTIDTQKLERNPNIVLNQKQVDELKLEKPVGSQGNVSKTYFVTDNAQKRYVLKQSVPMFYNQAASEVVASEMGQKAGINVNKVQLIPSDINHHLKSKGRSATLHEVVPGKALADQDDVPKISMVGTNGLNLASIRSIAHPDLAKIAALDTFTDNWDRGIHNTFYDKKTDSYHAIDMGASYNRIETAIPAIAKKTRSSLKDFDFNKLSESEKQGMQTYLGTLKTLYESNPPHETVNKYAHYLKLSGGNWDVFRRYVSAKEIYNNHRETGDLITLLEAKLNGASPNRYSADAYLDGFNSARLDKVNCEKGKPCKTKDGGKVCIPKTHKCASEISDDTKKKIAIAGGIALGAGAIGLAALATKPHIEKANFNDYVETPDELLSPELRAQKAYLQGQIDVTTESLNSLRQQEELAKKNFEKSKSQENYIKYKCAFLERATKEDDIFNLKFNITANGHKARRGENNQPDLVNNGRKVFVARHGEREDYATPGFKPQRKYDNPLSSNGIEQAKEMGASLKGKGITEIYASPFLRTMQTANAVAEELDLPIKVEHGMAEWHNPHWFTESPKPMSSQELQKMFPRVDTSYNSEHKPRYPENSDDVLDRVGKTVKNTLARSSGNVLLVGHGPTVIGGTKSLAKDSPVTLPQFAGVAEIENQNGTWKSNGLWHPTVNKKPPECRSKNDSAEIKADANPTCKKGKPCKTKSGGIVCIPKTHKCNNEISKDKNKIFAGVGIAALGVGGVGVAALVGGIALKDAFKPDIQILRRQEDEVFDKKTPLKGRVINEIPLESTDPTSYLKTPDNKSFVEPEFPKGTKVKKAGVVVIEPDGKFWMMEPLNHVGGTHNFAKGTVEEGLSIQQNALKEAKEELGLDVKIVDLLGDFGDNSGKNYTPDMDGSKEPIARYYIGVRTGGTPNDAHWEADKVKLVSSDSARHLFRQGKDWRDYSVIQSAADYTSDEPSRMKLADSFVQAEKDAKTRSKWKPSMSPQEAEEWAKDSVYKDELYHGTSKKSAEKIEKEGFRTDIKLWGSYYGRGVYTGRDLGDIEPYAKKHGENAAVLKLKANLKNVLYIDQAIESATQQQSHKEYIQKNWGPSTMQYIARHMNFEEDFRQAVDREKRRKKELSEELKLGHITKEQYNQRVSDNPESEAFSQLIQRAGYDAVTYHDSVFQQKKEFLIFDRKKVVTTGRVKSQSDSVDYWDSYNETMLRFDGRGKRCGKGYIPANAECKQGQSQIPKGKVRLRTPVTPVAALAGAAAIGLAGGAGIAAAKGSVKGQLKEAGTDKRIANLEYQTAEAKRKEVQTRLRQSESKLNELKEKEDKLTVKQKNLEGKLLDVTKTLAEAAQESGAPQALTGILTNEAERILKKDSLRSDGRGKRCGKGFIPANAKCKQGQSQIPQAKLKSPSASGALTTVAIAALGAAGGAAAVKEINGIKQDLTQLKAEKAEIQKLREATEAEIAKAKRQEAAIAANQQEIAGKETNLKKLEEEDRARKEKAEDMGALRRVATSAVRAGATAGMAGAALGPQGALVAGGAAAGLAASKTAAVELAKAVRRKKPDNLKNRTIAAVAESLPTGIESVATQQASGETAKSIVKESAQKLRSSNNLADEILATAAELIAEGVDEGVKTKGDLTSKGKAAGKRSVNTAKNIVKNRFKFFDSLSTVLHLDSSQILSVHLDNNAIVGKALIDDTIWDYEIADSEYQLNFNREDSVLFSSVLGNRFDAVKCGKGWISPGEKCRSGQTNPQKTRFLQQQLKKRPISRSLGDIANEIDNATLFAAARKKQIQEELSMRGKQLKNTFAGGSTKKKLRSFDDKLVNLEDKLANMSESSRRSVEGVAEGVKRKLEELKQSGRRNQRS